MSTMFQDVATMNIAFGNPRGGATPKRLISQCENIHDEYEELLKAIARRNIIEIRDAACDILVFAFGALHLMGSDYDNTVGLRDALKLKPIPHGLGHNGHFEYLMKYAAVFPARYARLMDNLTQANGPKLTVVIDLGDIIDFALGIYTLLNLPPEVDMTAVYESNMSKFCRTEEELNNTFEKYTNMEVVIYEDGQFPTKCVKSSYAQVVNGVNYPAHKFLKGVNYKPPVFA